MDSKKIKFNINKVEVKDLNGNTIPLPELPKILGNTIYTSVPKIDFLEIAQKIHASETVELTASQRDDLLSVLKNDKCGLIAFVRKAIIDHIKNL